MKETAFTVLEIAIVLLLVVAGILVAIPMVNSIYENKNSTQVEAYCCVDSKDTRTVLVGKTPVKRYILNVHVVDAEELKDSVTVSQTLYNAVAEGNEIKCVLFYTKEKLTRIEILE